MCNPAYLSSLLTFDLCRIHWGIVPSTVSRPPERRHFRYHRLRSLPGESGKAQSVRRDTRLGVVERPGPIGGPRVEGSHCLLMRAYIVHLVDVMFKLIFGQPRQADCNDQPSVEAILKGMRKRHATGDLPILIHTVRLLSSAKCAASDLVCSVVRYRYRSRLLDRHTLILTSVVSGVLTHGAETGGMYVTEKIYDDSDSDDLEKSLPDTGVHRHTDLLVVRADQEGTRS